MNAVEPLRATATTAAPATRSNPLLQRKCACGATNASVGEKCEECRSRALQRKRASGASSVQLKGDTAGAGRRSGHDFAKISLHQVARTGVAGGGRSVPFQNEIQPLMPGLDLSTVHAHTGPATESALRALGANAYATGNDLGLPANPPRHLVAHELAHVAQQRKGIQLNGGIGEEGDVHEVAADAIADRVASGRSAADLMPAPASPGARGTLQLDIRAPRSQEELNEEAVWLAKKQVKRKRFWNKYEDLPNYILVRLLESDEFRKQMAELDLEWIVPPRPFAFQRQKKGAFRRKDYVDVLEDEVVSNEKAKRIYGDILWAADHAPPENSWFDDVMSGICEYTNPCHDVRENQRANIANGMDPKEARERGLFQTLGWGVEQVAGNFGPSGGRGGPGEPPPRAPFDKVFPRPEPVPVGPPIATRAPLRPTAPIPIPGTTPAPAPVKPSPPAEEPKVSPSPPVASPKPTGPTAKVTPTSPTVTPKAAPKPTPTTSGPSPVVPSVPLPKGKTNDDPKKRKCGDADLPLTHAKIDAGPLGQGFSVKASPLTRCPGNTVGSKPDKSVYKDQFACISKAGHGGDWLRGHVLHGETSRTGKRNLHGPGTKDNLIIIDQTLNQAMSSWIESVVLDLLYGPYPHVLWLKVWVDAYYPGLDYFADSISIEYGRYDTKTGAEGPALNKGQFLLKEGRKAPACPA
jgi:hypothetical protein